MKNICVAKEPILRFNTLAMCLFKYVFMSFKRKKRERKSHPPPQKKKKSHAFINCHKDGERGRGEALVTPWQTLALLCRSPYALRV